MSDNRYVERGRPVTVLVRARTATSPAPGTVAETGAQEPAALRLKLRRSGPRNVLIRRQDGTVVVRPFRGLRRPGAADR